MIGSAEAKASNKTVSDLVGDAAFVIGAIFAAYGGKAAKALSKLKDTVIGGYISYKVSGTIQDEIISWFTVRAGTYTSIKCQYERNLKVAWFFPGIEWHSYELRIYPDYCEVWYSYISSNQVTIPQKVGEMTIFELLKELEGKI